MAVTQPNGVAGLGPFSIAGCNRLGPVAQVAPCAIVVIDAGGVITEFNAMAEVCFRSTADEAIGSDMRLLVTALPDGTGMAWVSDFLTGPTRPQHAVPRLIHARRRDGSTFPAELSLSVIDDRATRTYAAFFRDLSTHVAREPRRTATRGALLPVPSCSATGALTAELAHELTQPLAAASYFMSAGEALLADEANREQAIALMRLAGEQVLRCGDIIARVRAQATRPAAEIGETCVCEVIEDAVAPSLPGESGDAAVLDHERDSIAEIELLDRAQVADAVSQGTLPRSSPRHHGEI